MRVKYPYTDPRLTLVVKTADETINNSVTLQDDDELFVRLKINTRYHFEILCIFNSTTVADIKDQVTVPAGTVGRICEQFGGNGINTANLAGNTLNQNGFGLNEGSTGAFILWGWMTTGATLGNLQLQWAQANIEITDTTVKERSLMKLFELL